MIKIAWCVNQTGHIPILCRISRTTSPSGSAVLRARSMCRAQIITARWRACAAVCNSWRGAPKGYPEYVLHKMVTVVRDGQEVKLSKRAGAYVTVRDLIEWSGARAPTEENALLDEGEAIRRGRDAVRFFLASRRADTEFVFDVDLAAQQNDQNPVYYVQYAHARICSVLAQWGGEEERLINADVTVLTSESERALLSCLADYPDLLRRAADELAPHMLTFYLRALASCFHSFYNAERILVDEALRRTARIALIAATRQVLANGLAVVGVRAPVKM